MTEIDRTGLKLSGSPTMTDSSEPLPTIVGLAAYREVSIQTGRPPVRNWLILNGMNTGHFTSFFGAPCIADYLDCFGTLQALMEQYPDLVVIKYEISPKQD